MISAALLLLSNSLFSSLNIYFITQILLSKLNNYM